MTGWDWFSLLVVGSLLIEHYMDWRQTIEIEKHKLTLEYTEVRK